MRPIELSPRLGTVAGLVEPGTRFADVGTDHAYLPVFLLQRGVVDFAVVSDLRPGPLERARQTARRYGLSGRMSFRLGDGLDQIAPEEAQTIAIAGMGGDTIISILSAAPWTGRGTRRLLLQPMSALDDLRGWLAEHGFCIERELLCRDGGTRYTIMSVVPGQMPPLSPAERWAGRQSPEQCGPLRGELLDDLIRRSERALAGLSRSRRPSDLPRREAMEQVREGLIQMKKEWEAWQP